MFEWNWFAMPIRASYYFDRTPQDVVTRETFYIGFRYYEGKIIYLTEHGSQVGRSDTLRHRRMEA